MLGAEIPAFGLGRKRPLSLAVNVFGKDRSAAGSDEIARRPKNAIAVAPVHFWSPFPQEAARDAFQQINKFGTGRRVNDHQMNVILGAVTFDKPGLEFFANFGKNLSKVGNRSFREHVALLCYKDQMRMQRIPNMPSYSDKGILSHPVGPKTKPITAL
jgi:hypothetical protein